MKSKEININNSFHESHTSFFTTDSKAVIIHIRIITIIPTVNRASRVDKYFITLALRLVPKQKAWEINKVDRIYSNSWFLQQELNFANWYTRLNMLPKFTCLYLSLPQWGHKTVYEASRVTTVVLKIATSYFGEKVFFVTNSCSSGCFHPQMSLTVNDYVWKVQNTYTQTSPKYF